MRHLKWQTVNIEIYQWKLSYVIWMLNTIKIHELSQQKSMFYCNRSGIKWSASRQAVDSPSIDFLLKHVKQTVNKSKQVKLSLLCLTVIGCRAPESRVRSTSTELDKHGSLGQTVKVSHSFENTIRYSFLFFLVTICKNISGVNTSTGWLVVTHFC